MLETIIFHLGMERDGALTALAWNENHKVLTAKGFCHPSPYLPFVEPLRNLLKQSPQISSSSLPLPLTEPFISSYRTYLENTAIQSNPRILYIHFPRYPANQHLLPLVHALTQSVFPKSHHKAFISLVRQDINLMATCRSAAIFGRNGLPENIWLRKQQSSENYAYTSVLRDLFTYFGREHVECFVSDPASDTPEDVRYTALQAQEAFWRYAGVSVPPDPETGLACFRPRLEFCLPPEFHAFCRCCNTLKPNPYPPFTSPWAEQSLLFADQGPFFSSFSPVERAAFVAAHEENNAEAAALLGRDRLFTPIDVGQPYEPFTGLTEESAFKVAERLDRDFAAARMAEFDAIPIHYLTREQRICRQALHDVLDPPSSAPLNRAKADEEPKLSILTLTYNHVAYIAECIESVIAQKTNFPIQHIIADDASDDGTQDIILDYAARYPHIVPVFRKERYCQENIRALFDMARTEYVALCDGDDYFTDPAKLQTQVDLLDANKDAALCFHVVRVIYEGGVQPERLYPPDGSLPRGVRPFYYLSDLLRHNIMQTNSAMYRWRFRNGLPDWFRTNLTPGDWYWHLLHAEIGKIAFINTEMSVYRRHDKGVYWLSEVDAIKHRARVGMSELEVYDVINKHFDRKFESILLDLTNGVFADCLLYDTRQKEEAGAGADTAEEPVLDKLCDKYPDFARHFLASLKLVSAK